MTFCDDASDDTTIGDSELVVRAVHPTHWARVEGSENTVRPLRIAFNESSDGTGASVNLWSILQASGLPKTFNPPALAEKRKDHGYVEFEAGIPRGYGSKVVRHPLDDNPAHAAICSLSDEAKTALSRKATIVDIGRPRLPK